MFVGYYRRLHQLLMIGILLLGVLLSTESAAAAFKGCRVDPKVWLSDGVKLTMAVSIAADASQVRMITYTVHAPRTVTVNRMVYTGGALKDKEHVVMVFDRTSGYLIETHTDLIGVVAPVTVDAARGQIKRSATASSISPIVLLFP